MAEIIMIYPLRKGCYLTNGTYLKPGLYPIQRKVHNAPVEHFGILDVGNNSGHSQDGEPVVLHMISEEGGLICESFSRTGLWNIGPRVSDYYVGLVVARIHDFINSDIQYRLISNNCEHFVRYVINGKKESKQVNTLISSIAIFSLPWLLNRLDEK